jgi:protein phosphatase
MFSLSKIANCVESDEIKVSIYGSSDIGRYRRRNEDTFLFTNLSQSKNKPAIDSFSVDGLGSLMLVADGLGGATAGDLASNMAAAIMRAALSEMPQYLSPFQRLNSATLLANLRIHEYAKQNVEVRGMGTTLTAAYLVGNVAYISQVGDSRAYLLRDNKIEQLTKDQSLAQYLVDTGQILPEEISNVSQNIITQALGTEENVNAALSSVELHQGDFLLLCSDGLTNKVSDEEILEIVSSEFTIETAVHRLIDLANERGGEDNITVVIAHFDGKELVPNFMPVTAIDFQMYLQAA